MRNKRFALFSAIFFLILISSYAVTPVSAAKQVLIRITTPIPVGDEFALWCQEAMDRFNTRTGGAYKMRIFPGGQLAALTESLDAIRTGVIEGGVIPLAAFSGSVPEFSLAELPFLFNNGEANAYAETEITKVYDQLLEKKCNQKSLGCIYTGTMNLLSTKKQIKTLDDLKGMIVGCDNPPSAGLMKTLGGAGIIVDFTEDYSNLQKRVIDAKTSAPQYMLMSKLYEVAKYYTVFHGLGSLYSININLDTYNKMPKKVKDILNEEMSAVARSISQKYVKKFYDLIPEAKSKGVQYYYLPVTERNKWKALAYQGTLDELAKFGDVGNKIKQIADKANKKYPYIAK